MAHSKAEAKNAKFYISKEDWNKVIAYAESSYHQMKAEIGGQMVVVEDDHRRHAGVRVLHDARRRDRRGRYERSPGRYRRPRVAAARAGTLR